MPSSVLRFVRLPHILLLIWTVGRFALSLSGLPYAPRGNAVFSIVGLTIISCLYYGAISKTVGGYDWKGTALVGIAIGLFSQILIFAATAISYAASLNTYFLHWDALNIPEGSTPTLGQILGARGGGLIAGGVIIPSLVALIGRAFAFAAPVRRPY
ncbi:MAG TPA: hypothetical protein VFY29_19900 [Terriglobia bacterium]|nr:hypothetical protein [Terriglobia bacterium]